MKVMGPRRLTVAAWVLALLVAGVGMAVGSARAAGHPRKTPPLVYEQKLTGDKQSVFGNSVALSADGKTALVGAPGDGNNTGAAWVFTRKGTKWVEQQKLTPPRSGPNGRIGHNDEFGFSVALSGDGNTALIGAPGDNAGIGAAWMFIRERGSWINPRKVQSPIGMEIGAARFGYSVSLSSHGQSALIGGPLDNNGLGAAWRFIRLLYPSGPDLAAQRKLTANGETGNAQFGFSVSLSGSGTAGVVGGPLDNPSINDFGARISIGAAWVFRRLDRTGGNETKLAGPVVSELGTFFGTSVAISADKSAVLVGGPEQYVYTFGVTELFEPGPGNTWTLRQRMISADHGPDYPGAFGKSLTLSADGNTALIGDPFDGSVGPGAVVRGVAWLLTDVKSRVEYHRLAAPKSTEPHNEEFGFAVALSSSASTALIGGPTVNQGPGNGAWVFAAPVSTPIHVPAAPGGVSATAGNHQATVKFNPIHTHGYSILRYTATASPGGYQASGKGSPIIVKGLKNGTKYTFTVTATDAAGTGPPSKPSNPVIPR